MMTTSHLSAAFATSCSLLLALSASQNCWAVFVYFDGSTSTEFQLATNWSPENGPGTNAVDIYGIDDGLSSTFSGGTTRVKGLRVGSAAKEHQIGETHFGRLTMTGGMLEVTGSGAQGLFGVGRERENIIQDDDKKGGELILTGASTITANGVIIGERTKGLLSIGPAALVDLRTWVTIDEPNHFGGAEDIRIGNYGPAYDDFGAEPGLDGRGLVDVYGALKAKDMYMSEHGAQGELRLSGGSVNLNGALIMDLCENCLPNPALLAQRSAKVTIIGSNGTFNVGLDADPLVVNPSPSSRDLLAASPTAIFSFTADAGGVTPITMVQNVGEPSGGAEIEGAQLELNLDAFDFTPTSTLTLIDATALTLLGEFGTVTFLGGTTADVNYDLPNGNVFLDNFQAPAIDGDFDLDGDVDGKDFLTWQRGLGIMGTATVAQGDADGNHTVNANDLTIWRQNFGPGASVASVSSVPEPIAGLLALLGVAALGVTARRRQPRTVPRSRRKAMQVSPLTIICR
jgi:MYXO-CTERM domain-containing protein